ncbi:hypothetical protein EU522_01475 [Candidatus Thorarchaeota archaeon]|nr:MAG: hypothetical protein EU522_01475 [Candidatus Thorarchaeota archaeon]
MSETEDAWKRVLAAFDDWIYYESTEFGPWTGYFSLENLRDLTDQERLGWMHSMIDEIIPGRVDKCKEAGIALEDFLPYMPDSAAIETVNSMIDLNSLLQDLMLRMSDIIGSMMDSYREGGLDEILPSLESLAESEEEIRHHMSLFSQGFGKLKSLGLEMPEDLA